MKKIHWKCFIYYLFSFPLEFVSAKFVVVKYIFCMGAQLPILNHDIHSLVRIKVSFHLIKFDGQQIPVNLVKQTSN